MVDHGYEEGVRDGKIESLEKAQIAHDKRFDHHDKRLSTVEKMAYSVIGIIAFIQLIPLINKVIGIE